ncbi:MAG: hypothetical protein LBP23_02255 [Treponema sp.]|jgi:hypothetical protein|nr:hypothetical protein [Treponema sp.]
MRDKKTGGLIDRLSDRFGGIWKLLSETTVFLSRTSELYHYEDQLRHWREELYRSGRDSAAVARIRGEITELRKQLRLQGYDLSLGKQHLIIDRFRNDSCMAEGFRRVVLFFSAGAIYFLTGTDNHIALDELLEDHVGKISRAGKRIIIKEKHYLWYRRQGADLILSGADTETKEDFERLKAMGASNSLFLLSGLKQLK